MNAPTHPSVATTCPYCGVGCGLLVRPDGSGGAVIAGDPDHPANFGHLCSKGFALAETLGLEQRLMYPTLRGQDGALVRASWEQALGTVAQGFHRIVERDGPDAVAFYLSGQLLTEDYYVANKLMKGFIGSGNVDTNSRLCMASTVAGHRRSFGADVVPGTYRDLDAADLLVLVGSNTAWCHPVLFQRMVRNRAARGTKIVVVDPRRTFTGGEADLFLPTALGSDATLFCGLLVHLTQTDALDRCYIDSHTTGFPDALARAREIAPDVPAITSATGLSDAQVSEFFNLFRTIPRVVTCFSQGVNQSRQGTDKVNAIINCHLATGRIGKPGMGPFSLTGQPNAMGGREVGGLANQLAAHMDFTPSDIDRVRRFWSAPRMASHDGLKAVQMFEAIERGKIKALWVMATNPAVSLPRTARVRDALEGLDLFVVSDNVLSNDTINSSAHVLLPAAAWGEKHGTVTNSERCISRQRAFLPLPGEARPDWWIVCEVAKRMGFSEAFSYDSIADIFREHAALSCFENDGSRPFDIGGLAAISDQEYCALAPGQWPIRADGSRAKRFFAAGGFFTSDGKARFIAPDAPAFAEATSCDFPLRLNTGRLRDQWHTMTRTGLSVRLGAHRPEPFVEVHPYDAATYRLKGDGFAQVTTRYGACVVKVVTNTGQQKGSIFVPIHWSEETSSSARVGDLVTAACDPISGQPEAKATPAAVASVSFAFRGYALARRPFALPARTWWARRSAQDAVAYSLATNDGPMFWHDLAPHLFGDHAVLTEYISRPQGIYRAAAFVEGRLIGCLLVAPADESVQSGFAMNLLAPNEWTGSGHPESPMFADFPTICACFGTGLRAIRDAIISKSASNVAEIGLALRAGTKCGTCLPELRSIVAHESCALAI